MPEVTDWIMAGSAAATFFVTLVLAYHNWRAFDDNREDRQERRLAAERDVSLRLAEALGKQGHLPPAQEIYAAPQMITAGQEKEERTRLSGAVARANVIADELLGKLQTG